MTYFLSAFLQKPDSEVRSAFSPPHKSTMFHIIYLEDSCTLHIGDSTQMSGEDRNALSLAHTFTCHTLHISKIINASKNVLPPTEHLPCSFTNSDLPPPFPPWFYKAISEVKSMLCRLKATMDQGLSFIYL